MVGWRTFTLSVLALTGTWLGVYLNMFDPSVFTNALMYVVPAYAAKSVGAKFAEGYVSKHDHSKK